MKCISPECENDATDCFWCDKCLDELGNYIEEHGMGFIPSYKTNNLIK